jgi:hypothetical protein
VEQKNWSVVRKTVGCHRYDTGTELGLLNETYALLRLMTDFFTRSGSRSPRPATAPR